MVAIMLLHAIMALHYSHGPSGWTVWIQPPHVYAGVSVTRKVTYIGWEIQR